MTSTLPGILRYYFTWSLHWLWVDSFGQSSFYLTLSMAMLEVHGMRGVSKKKPHHPHYPLMTVCSPLLPALQWVVACCLPSKPDHIQPGQISVLLCSLRGWTTFFFQFPLPGIFSLSPSMLYTFIIVITSTHFFLFTLRCDFYNWLDPDC